MKATTLKATIENSNINPKLIRAVVAQLGGFPCLPFAFIGDAHEFARLGHMGCIPKVATRRSYAGHCTAKNQ